VICPRCSVGEISDQTHECTLCGFAPSSVITLATPFPRELEDSARQELEHQFQIEGVLGRTARSVVYLALERAENRLVALKVLPRTAAMAPEAGTALQREIALAATLDHPHILPVYRSGDTRVLLWYSMEYCNGRSLAEVLGDGAPMDLAGALRIVQQIASALDYAHRRGIAHGGLTPENVLIDSHGWVRVSDFGVRRAFGRPAALPSDAPELRYLAPEHFAPRNLAGPSADQYALAVLTYDCLVGFASTGRPSPARLELPPRVFDALQRATSEQASARFATVLDFVVALEGTAPAPAARTSPVPATPPRLSPAAGSTPAAPRRSSNAPLLVIEENPAPPVPTRRSPAHRLRLAAWIGGGVLALFALFLTWLFWPVAPAPTITTLQPVQTLGGTSGDSGGIAAPAASPPAAPATPTALPTPIRTPVSSPGAPAPRPAARVGTGKLFISATPWAELSIDGRPVGNTPRANLELPAGTHRLHLQRDGFLPYDTSITVAPGATVRLTDIVLKAIGQ
jgi:serine/threonine protein kinase